MKVYGLWCKVLVGLLVLADGMIVSAVRTFIAADGTMFSNLLQRYEVSVERQWAVSDVVRAFPTACAISFKSFSF